MTILAPPPASPPSKARSAWEKSVEWGIVQLTAIAALFILILLLAIAGMIVYAALPAIRTYGLAFFTATTWNAVEGRETYGALALIWGTVISSALALFIAVPLGVGTAIFLSEDLLPSRIRSVLGILVELLAAIPSVVYGLWGIVVLVPLLQPLTRWLYQQWGWVPLFSTPPLGLGLLPAVLVLAIMVLPIITAIARDSLMALPIDLRFAAMALGATRWDAIARVFLPAASPGITGGIMLALGRALGETMAVTMLIGNVNQISPSLLAPANTIASLLANQFAAAKGMQISALMYAALTLLGITLLVNALAEGIVYRVTRPFQSH
ncbi:MAG: phosphate ABC transporter permease subunit PstC [Cyanobacteria bacterium J06635_15]